MVNKAQKKEMMDYVASNLEGAGYPVISISATPNCILLKDKGLVLLADKNYTANAFSDIYSKAKSLSPQVAVLFYKDGETFFRSAFAGVDKTGIKSKTYKLSDKGTLKHYIHNSGNIISLRPEELYVSRNLGKVLQYYQPTSDRLEQGIVSYKFEPVVLDQSHISSEERFGPIERDSERLSIWNKKGFNSGKLTLEDGLLRARV